MPLPATRWSRAASRLTLAAAVTFATVIAVGGTAAAATSRPALAITAGPAAAASKPGKSIRSWGDNPFGELGDGSGITSSDVPVRVELPSGWRASALGAGPGAAHALAIGPRR
jgi:hypothetical protein